MLSLSRFGALAGVSYGLFIAAPRLALPRTPTAAAADAVAPPLFALLARVPDTPLIRGLHVIVGLTLVWLSLAPRARLGAWEPSAAGSRP